MGPRKQSSKLKGAAGSPPRKQRSRRPTDIAKTALGEVPKKRGLKKVAEGEMRGPRSKPEADLVSSGGGQRDLRVNLKTARKHKHSSQLWLERQLNDPFVARARAEGWRSRAAFKLIEMNEKYALLKPGARVVDLGCAPGGWLQVAVKEGAARVVGIDYLHVPAIAGADILEMDFLDADAPETLKRRLGGPADLVLSDMAAPTTGHRGTDHLRIIALAEAALAFAEDVLAPGGSFVCKVFQGGAEGELLAGLKQHFASVRHAKPKASRAESSEMYVVASGFRGGNR